MQLSFCKHSYPVSANPRSAPEFINIGILAVWELGNFKCFDGCLIFVIMSGETGDLYKDNQEEEAEEAGAAAVVADVDVMISLLEGGC